MLNTGRVALVISTVAALALAAWWILIQVQDRQETRQDIVAITFHQSQAVQDFDDREYTQREPQALEQFQSLLDRFDVEPGSTLVDAGGSCPGSLVSELRIQYPEGQPVPMALTTCGASAFEEFNQEASALLTQWRKALD